MVDWVARDMAMRKEHIRFYARELCMVLGENELLNQIKQNFGGFPKDSLELHNFLADLYRKNIGGKNGRNK